MILKNKLSYLGILIISTSLIVYLVLHLLLFKGIGIGIFLIGIIGLLCHQMTTWWIFYRFAMTRQRMKNRLEFMHQVALATTLLFSLIFLVVNRIWSTHLNERSSGIHNLIILLLIGVYVVYQENNTHNFITIDFHKKVKQSKKALNQYIGFTLNWILINVMWNSLGLGQGLPVFAFVYVFLILVQNSLNYTTYAQSKYWNFTYEAIVLVHLYSLAMQKGWAWLIGLSGLFAIVLFLRQWRWQNYKKHSIAIGILMLVLFNSIFFIKTMQGQYDQQLLSKIIPLPFILHLIILAIIYIINEPLFYKRLLKQ